MAKPSLKQTAWRLFDRITEKAMSTEAFAAGPWTRDGEYVPDYETLQALLGVPLYIKAESQSGVPALALDVWTAYELRRAGFEHDAVWPRHQHPRVMPKPISRFQAAAPRAIREAVDKQLAKVTPVKGVVATDANILGRHYIKQVDVVMSAWETGPEILISTKRMDSSFGKNAANRIEEAYGDAKNLRHRHPLAAHGFLYGLRDTILDSEPGKAAWLIDLLGKLAEEDDAYDTVCLLMLNYDAAPPVGSDGGAADEADSAAIDLEGNRAEDEPEEQAGSITEIEATLRVLPQVTIRDIEAVPAELRAPAFFARIVEHVLSNTPITMHRGARKLRGWPTVERDL